MAWTDSATDGQVYALLKLLPGVYGKEQERMGEYLKSNFTRKELSDELQRIHSLYVSRSLNRENAFASKIWSKYDFRDTTPSERQVSLVFSLFMFCMPVSRAVATSNWLKTNSTMEEVTREIDRLKDLKKRHALDQEECFNSEIWSKCPFTGKEVAN